MPATRAAEGLSSPPLSRPVDRAKGWLRDKGWASAALYAAWLAVLIAGAPSWLPAVRVQLGAERKDSPYAALLSYSYLDGKLELRFYRGFACPLAQVEVRVTTLSGAQTYVKQRVPPSREFTVSFYVEEPEVLVEVYVGDKLTLKTTLMLAG